MNVALYTRVSAVRQAKKELSNSAQFHQMRGWCESHGYHVVAEYTEPGATAPDDRRPVFQLMTNEACLGPSTFQAIVTHSLSSGAK